MKKYPSNVMPSGLVLRAPAVIIQKDVRRAIGPDGKEIWVKAKGYHRGVDHAYVKKERYSAKRKDKGRWTN